MQQRQKHAVFQQEINRYRTLLECLKIQSGFGVIISEKLALFIERYSKSAALLTQKQKELNTLFLYNNRLIQTIQSFGEHEKRILARLHSLQLLNTKIIRQFCLKKNKACKIDQYYKPIEAIYSNIQVGKWKFQVKQPIQVDFNSYYNKRIFQIFQKYLLPKQQLIVSLVQQKLKQSALNSSKQASNFNNKIKVDSLIALKQKVQKYHTRRQLVQPQNVFDVFQERRQIIQQASMLQNVGMNNIFFDRRKQENFLQEVAKVHAKIQNISQQQLIQMLREERGRQIKMRKERLISITEHQLNFKRIIDENIYLKSEHDKLNAQLITFKQEVRQLRISLKENEMSKQYELMKKELQCSNSTELYRQIEKQRQNSKELQKEIDQLKNQLIDERRLNFQLKEKNIQISSEQEILIKSLREEISTLHHQYQDLRQQKQNDNQVQAYLLTIPYPILIFPKIDVKLPSQSLSILRKVLIQNQLIQQGQEIEQQQIVKKAIKILKCMTQQSKKTEFEFKQVIQDRQRVIYQKQIQYQQVIKEIEVIKVQYEKVARDKQIAVSRMNKSQDLACQATSIILDTALKGPELVIREIEEALEQIKELLRVDDIEVQSPHKYKQPARQAQLSQFDGQNNFIDQNRSIHQKDRINDNSRERNNKRHRQSVRQQLQGERFSFNRQILRKQTMQQSEEDRMRTGRSQSFDEHPQSNRNPSQKEQKQRNASYNKKDKQESQMGEAKTQKNQATVPQEVKKQEMKCTILARDQQNVSRSSYPYISTYIKRKSNQYHRPSSSNHEKIGQEMRNTRVTSKNKTNIGKQEETQYQRNNTPKRSHQISKKQQKYQYQDRNKQTQKQQQQNKTSINFEANRRQQKQIIKEELINSSGFSAIHKINAKVNDSVQNILKNDEQQSFQGINDQQKQISNEQRQIRNNQQNNIKRSSRVFFASDLQSQDNILETGPLSPVFLSSQGNKFSIQANRFANQDAETHQNQKNQVNAVSGQEKSTGQGSIKGQKQLQLLKKKYKQLLQKKLELDRKLQSRSLQPDQSQIKVFLKRMRQFEMALHRAQAVNMKYQLDYQNFLQNLRDSGEIDTRQKIEEKIFFLVKRVRELQITIEEQKKQFESSIKRQIKKSESVAFQIMKQFQQNQLQESRRLSESRSSRNN